MGHLDNSKASQYLMGTLVASPVEEIHVVVWYLIIKHINLMKGLSG